MHPACSEDGGPVSPQGLPCPPWMLAPLQARCFTDEPGSTSNFPFSQGASPFQSQCLVNSGRRLPLSLPRVPTKELLFPAQIQGVCWVPTTARGGMRSPGHPKVRTQNSETRKDRLPRRPHSPTTWCSCPCGPFLWSGLGLVTHFLPIKYGR